MINPELITTGISGSLTAGDIITFEGRPSWRRRLWCAIRYMRHNNPLLKPPRQFVVSYGGGGCGSKEIRIEEYCNAT